MSRGQLIGFLLVLGVVLSSCAPLSAVAEDVLLTPVPEVVTEPEEIVEETEEVIETEEDLPLDPVEIVTEVEEAEEEFPPDFEEETLPEVEELLVKEPPTVETNADTEEDKTEALEVPIEEEFFAPFNLFVAPEEPEDEGEIIYDFPTYLWGSSNGAFASGSAIGPHLPGMYSFSDLGGQWDSVAGDFTRWNDPDTSYTFNRLDVFLAVQDLPGLGPLDSNPLTAGTIQVNIYAANESWQKGALITTSLPVDAATLFLQKTGICRALGVSGAPFSDECVVEFTFDTLTLEAGQRYLFEVTAEDVVSAAPFFRDRYYYPSLLVVGVGVTKDPWYGADGVQDAPHHNTGAVYMRLMRTEFEPTGASSVLFLPGFLGSRLYDESGRKLWEPNGTDDFLDLALNPDGTAVVPAYVGEVVDRVRPDGGPPLQTVYGELMEWLAELASADQIAGWAGYAYDWRYDVFDVIDNGALKEDGSRDYLIPLLENLANASKNGQVTVIGHSNGGLLAKALMIRLAEEGKENLVDKVVLVGSPQVGTPQGMLGLLHGHEIARPFWTPQGIARASAVTMPGAYALLPSAAYFENPHLPVATFEEGTSTEGYRNTLGETLESFLEATLFLQNDPFTRDTPTIFDEETPYPLSSVLLTQATETHAVLDTWTPPEGVTVHEIAGWGNKTIIGARYYTEQSYSCPLGILSCGLHDSLDYEPETVGDGDDTVVASSALFMDSGVYFNLYKLGIDFEEYRKHESLTESSKIHEYLAHLFGFEGEYNETLFTLSEPAGTGNDIVVSVHSPVIISLKDSEGHETGIFPYPDSDLYYILEDIPGSSVEFGGEGKYISVPLDGTYEISVQGIGEGTFTIKVQKEEDGATSIANVPVTNNTFASTIIEGDANSFSALEIDEDGDGTTDITIAFQLGETVIYQKVEPTVEEETSTSGGGSSERQNQPTGTTTSPEFIIEGTEPSNPFLNPPVPFLPTYSDVGVKAPNTPTNTEVAQHNTQTASAYNAAAGIFDWLAQIVQEIISWISSLFTLR